MPAFLVRSFRIMKQSDAASGIIGWSLGFDLLKNEFHTLSVWEDAQSLRHFVHDGDHGATLDEFKPEMRRKTIFVYYKVMGRDLPLTWRDAIARQERQDAR
jgi:hypothetical protein